ncbi:putative mgmt family protein [Botrytis fragariae]|uniref:Putative mgmt family protein n=1 Tax=Botrytis fragariae TaxID=1964551 RepID=A0A8H6AWV3_9HELO|nr:putative mgmt family protein [Botrytis fragariae]KAF5874870.1 putative mgmt family protein [Botrytis fragariae]
MPRTDEATSFYHSVYSAIQEIPHGKVTTYGHIARLIGTPNRPRQVGICLKHLPNSPSTSSPTPTPTHLFHNGNVPWQRVINAKGGISPRSHPSGAQNQAAILRSEGIEVTIGSLNTLLISLPTYGWFPRQLPSEEAAGLDPPINSDSDSDSEGGGGGDGAEE